MTFLLLLLGLLLFFLVLLLFLPFSYRIRYHLGEEVHYQADLGSPLVGLHAKGAGNNVFRFLFFGVYSRPLSGKESGKRSSGKKQPAAERKTNKTRFPTSLLKREYIKHVVRFSSDLLAMLKPGIFWLNVRAGFVEPEYNGLALAIFYGLASTFREFPVYWETVWEQETLEADGEVAGRFIPAFVLWRILVFLFSHPTLRLLQQMRRQKKATA